MADIFLSYNRDDQAVARRFAEAFIHEGLSVWWDQTLRSGEAYDKVTEKALEEAGAVVVLWSKRSVDSRWVRAEATQAERNGTLMPVMIEACKRPIMFELTHTADLSSWKGDTNDKAWLSFLGDVRQFVNKASPVAASPGSPLPDRPQRNFGLKIAGGALLLIAAVTLWWFFAGRTEAPRSFPGNGALTADTAAPAAAVTLAVLPFADMSPAHDQDYFSDGLTEELLNQLANIKGLRVTARTSSFQFKGKGEDVRVIGEKLGVANILEGSVRKDGNQLRITAQLNNSRDGSHLWSKTYDRELSGVFALQEEVSRDVARALSTTLDVGDLPRIQGGTTNVEAYDKYLLARSLFHQNGPAESRQAAQLLRESVKLDSQFSRAWSLLSHTLYESLNGVPDSEAGPVRDEARAATARVMALDPDAWGAQLLRVNQLIGQKKWAQAEAALIAVVERNAPTYGDEEVAVTSGFLYRSIGRVRETVRIFEQARDRDPLSLYVSSDLQTWLDAAGRPVDAQAEYLRSKSLAGNHGQANIFATLRLLARKDATEAAKKAQFRILLEEEKVVIPLSHALAAKFGNHEQAREAISQAIGSPENQDRIRMTIAMMYADRFNETDLALAAMKKVTLDFGAIEALWMPLSTEVRSDPRFKELVRTTGLPDYWRSSGKWGDFCKPVGSTDFECH